MTSPMSETYESVQTDDATAAPANGSVRKRGKRLTALRNHLVGMGVPMVTIEGSGWARDLHLPGYNLTTVTNGTALVQRDGRRTFFDKRRDGTGKPLIVVNLPSGDDPEDAFAMIPVNDLIAIIKGQGVGT